MSKNVFIYEHGFCRGDEFSDKLSFDKVGLVNVLEEALQWNGANLEDFIDRLCASDSNFSANCIIEIMSGGTIYGKEEWRQNRVDWLKAIKNDAYFFIDGEEGNWGIGSTPKDAMIAYALGNNEYHENDWN